MLMMSLDKIDELFALISQNQALYIPADNKDGAAEYTRWSEGVKYSSALNTVRSAKDFFFPQTENLVDFKMEGKNIEIIDIREEAEDFVLFGVRACDAKSFSILDSVYLTEPVDSYYKTRREHGTVITMVCNKPSETCFCSAFGIDASQPGGDVECTNDGKNLYFEAKTEKGKAFTETISSLLTEGDASGAETVKAETKEILAKLPLSGLSTEAFGGDKLNEHFNSEKWASLSEACLGCGTCTFVCPTCQCYDIRDFDTGHGIKRFRCWDSCMYSDFTKTAGGNPRLTQLERFRQRFMHKLVYYPANNDGVFGCVGCGRCLAKCPISMNIVKVMKALEVK